MEEPAKEVLVCTIITPASIVYGKSMKTRKQKEKYWVRDHFRVRNQYGAYMLTFERLRCNDSFSC